MRVSRRGFRSIAGPWPATLLIAAACCGTACATSQEVAEARLEEERWERAPGTPVTASADAAAVAATEQVRFDPGTAALTASARASLERLASRLRAADPACQVDLRSAPNAASDPELAQQRAAAARRYLSRQLGIAAERISDDRSVERSGAAAGGARCVLVANLG